MTKTYLECSNTIKSYEQLFQIYDSDGFFPMRTILESKMGENDIDKMNYMKWKGALLTFISCGLKDYLEFIDRKNTMSEPALTSTANLILDEFNTLTIYDIPLFIRMCKLSRFGELKDLNGSVILRWLSQYIKERDAARNNHIYDIVVSEQRQKVNDCDETVVDSEKIDEIFSRLMSKFDNKNATT